MKILLAALTSSFMLVGCTPRIEVAAPKEPITINMNVKIEHEIIIKADKDVEELLETRKASYQQLAKQNNVSVDDIAKLAGQKLVERAKPGEYVQGINGKWVRKF